MAFHSTFSPTFFNLFTSGAVAGPVALGANTLAAWVNFNSLATDGEIIEVNATGGGNGSFDSAIIYQQASAKLEFTQRSSTQNRDTLVTFTVNTNTWIHVALTWDGTNLRCYVNGALLASNTTGALTGTRGNWANLQVGPATADLQDAVFYTAALSADEILGLYRSRLPARRNNLLVHLPCFPGANRGVDYSGNAINFTTTGTTDSTIEPPPAGWGSARANIVLPAASANLLVADGNTQCTGAVTVGRSQGITAAGLTQCTGGTQFGPALSCAGSVQCTGAVAVGKTYAITAAGLTQCTGAAQMSLAAALVADGLTRTFGTAAVSGNSPTGVPTAVRNWRNDRRGR